MKSLNHFKRNELDVLQSYALDLRQQVARPSDFAGEVALEMELEGRNLPVRYGGEPVDGVTWVAHDEGSLRGGGREYVMSEPASADTTRQLLDRLFADIAAQGGRIENSTRCSTHVHLNMSGVKINALASFVVLYGTFEDALTNYCAPCRRGNLFALRLSDSSFGVDGWRSAFSSGDFDWHNDRRYLALNPAALNKFGSLEVRTLQGVTSTAEVMPWVSALLALRSLALSADYRDPSTIAPRISGLGGDGFFDEVFGTASPEVAAVVRERTPDLDRLVRDGFRRMQPIAFSLPWDRVIPETERVFIFDPFGGGATKTKRRAVRHGAEINL